MTRVLFVASLHHPEQLRLEMAQTPPNSAPALFPTSMGQHFWERAMRKRGWEVQVFWRNLSGFGNGDIRALRQSVHSERLTPRKVIDALLRRLPPAINPDVRRRNTRLLARAVTEKPDILWLVGDNTVIYPETLAAIKEQIGCRLIYASGTSPIVFSHAIERRAARLYDLVLVNDYYHGVQWLELGAQRMECLPIAAVDPSYHVPQTLDVDEQRAYACAVTFVGTLVPDHLYSERRRALEALSDYELGIWSVHEVPPSLRPYYRGRALGGQMMRVLSGATISLNIHGDFMRYGGNMRLFESAAVGAFQIADDRPGIHQWFNVGEHLVTYRNHAELRQLVAHYLARPDDRHRIAQAARQHVYQHHTYDQRLARVAQLLTEMS